MNLNTLARVTAHNQIALREGLKIVRKVVASNPYPAGFTTAELFKLVAKQTPPADFKPLKLPPHPVSNTRNGSKRTLPPLPPRPHHPIKSMTFLKRAVLPILEGNKELEMVRTTRIPFNPAPTTPRAGGKRKNTPHAASAAAPARVTVWVWKPIDKSKLPLPPAPKPPRKVFGTEVGVGEDWSHLSKRRGRARVGKVRRDVSAMRVNQLVSEQKVRARARKAAVTGKADVVRAAESRVSSGLEAMGTHQKNLKEGRSTVKEAPSVVRTSRVIST